MDLQQHPSVRRSRERAASQSAVAVPARLDPKWVRQIVLDAGADDVGLASIENPELAGYRSKILTLFPKAKTCISVICRMNPVNVRSPFRQQYELEYHHMYAEVDHVARRAAVKFLDNGIGAMDVCSSYPMNMEDWPGAGMWYVAHKPVAAASGRGRMGLNHLIVHTRFGAIIALSSILLDRELTEYDQPLDFDPCVKCMLCVTSCPVGALNADGHFNSIACVTHSYRLKYGGFTHWVENIVKSRNVLSYRRRVSDQETVLMWQGLGLGTTYQCTNCMAVCPGGEDLVGLYADDQKSYRETVAKRLQDKKETVYVVKGSDADAHVRKRFPHKTVKHVENGVRAATAASFLENLHILFQREQSKGLAATYHFSFTGEEEIQATITIRDKTLEVKNGLIGKCDVQVSADSPTWIQLTSKERSFLGALLTRKLRVKGPKKLLDAFARCFPA